MKYSSRCFIVKLKVIWLLLFTAATCFYSFAQETRTDEEIDILLDELFFSEEQMIDDFLASLNRNHFIYSSFTFNSDTFFSGRESGVDQYNFYPQMTYYHPTGFNISLSGLYYQKFDPNWDFTSISLGYYHNIDEKELLYLSAGYTRYIFSDGSNYFTNLLDLSLGLRNSTRTIGSELYTSLLFGSDSALQLILRTYGRITLLKEKTFSLRFRPQLKILVAQQTLALEELNSQTQQTEFVNYDVFDLLNSQLNLPLSLVSKSWNFDIGYNINFPKAITTEPELKTTGYFSVSLGYLIKIKD